MSETSKCISAILPHIKGNVIDIGSGGFPVVPHAIQIELPEDQYAYYNSNHPPGSPIQWRGDALSLPFKDGTVETVFSSHLIEDYLDWNPVLQEWARVVKPGGNLVILLPDKQRWNEAIARGQPCNCAHKHESYPGELSTYADRLGLDVIEDRLTNLFEFDYSILFVGRKR